MLLFYPDKFLIILLVKYANLFLQSLVATLYYYPKAVSYPTPTYYYPRAVSYPTPTYYAHLVADRARQHHNELSSVDGGSVGSSSSPCELTEKQKMDIKKQVEKTVRQPMYFV